MDARTEKLYRKASNPIHERDPIRLPGRARFRAVVLAACGVAAIIAVMAGTLLAEPGCAEAPTSELGALACRLLP